MSASVISNVIVTDCCLWGGHPPEKPGKLGNFTVTVTELHFSTMFSEESCSVGLSEKMGFQLRSELLCGERRSGGSVFQTTGAAMEKLRWLMDMFARKMNRSPRSAERSDRRDKFETGQMTCLR